VNQFQRDRRAILAVLPPDGSRISVAELYLRAGENLGATIRKLIERNVIARTEHDGLGYLNIIV